MSRQYGNFKLIDYFDIRYGKFVKKNQIGDTPYITTTAFNNGIGGSLDAEPMFKGNCITIASDGSVGSTFYQQNPFSASNIVVVLEPKETTPLNRYNAQYLATRIRVYAEQTFDYGKKFSVNRVRATELEFPMTDEGNIDWEYMETYMKTIEEESEHIIEMLNSVTLNEGGGLTLEPYSFEEFKMGDLFEIKPSKSYKDLKDDFIISDIGETPFITTTKETQGVKGYTKLEPLNEGGMISASDTTDHNSIFYREEGWVGRSHVQGLTPREHVKMNKYTGLYLVTAFRESAKVGGYDYGNKFNRKNMNATIINLPTTETGEIDWDYMETYMKFIEGESEHIIGVLGKDIISMGSI